jgi:hypothetical protein
MDLKVGKHLKLNYKIVTSSLVTKQSEATWLGGGSNLYFQGFVDCFMNEKDFINLSCS